MWWCVWLDTVRRHKRTRLVRTAGEGGHIEHLRPNPAAREQQGHKETLNETRGLGGQVETNTSNPSRDRDEKLTGPDVKGHGVGAVLVGNVAESFEVRGDGELDGAVDAAVRLPVGRRLQDLSVGGGPDDGGGGEASGRAAQGHCPVSRLFHLHVDGSYDLWRTCGWKSWGSRPGGQTLKTTNIRRRKSSLPRTLTSRSPLVCICISGTAMTHW